MTINEHIAAVKSRIVECEKKLEEQIELDDAMIARDAWHYDKICLNYAKSVLARVPEKFSEVIRSIEFQKGETFFGGKINLFYVGTIGTGKTTQAYLVCAVNAIRDRLSFTMIRWAQFFSFTAQDTEEISNAMNVDILILDDVANNDFSSEKMSDIARMKFDEIIDYRYSHKLKTIFTTNSTVSDIKNRISAQSKSRIFESCNIVSMIGEDRRGK